MHEGGDTVNVDSLPWLPLAPHVMLKVIKTVPETGGYSVIIKADEGGVLPKHKHLASAEIFILNGAGVHPQTGAYAKGDYISERKNAVHDQLRFAEDTELLMIANGPSAFLGENDEVMFLMDVAMLEGMAAEGA